MLAALPKSKGRWVPLSLLGSMTVLGIFWTKIVIPNILTPTFESLSVFIAYPLFNIGWILTFSGGLGFLLHLKAPRSFNLSQSLMAGLGGWVFSSWVYDMWQPPFYLSPEGHVLIPLNVAGENTAVDGFFATLWATIWPAITGTPAWYDLTYIYTSILGIVVIALLWFSGFISAGRKRQILGGI